MPRSLVLGNGNILICYDNFGQVKDFYCPYVGEENHTSDCVHKIGVWVDGAFSWLSDSSWVISIDYDKNSLASLIVAKNARLELTVIFRDVIYNEEDSDYYQHVVAMFDRGVDISELNNILELVSDAWNYFPHKSLNGLSPTEKLLEYQDKQKKE